MAKNKNILIYYPVVLTDSIFTAFSVSDINLNFIWFGLAFFFHCSI